jgi:Domain of unknown function (DUF4412)
MKGLIAALLAATLGPAAADLTIVQQVQKEGAPQEATVTLTMKIKDGKMRVELGPQVSSIIDLKTGDVVSLLHPQRIAMTIPGASIKSVQRALTEEAIKSVGSSPPPKPTGRKETISGFVCEEFETTANETNFRLWITRDLPGTEKLLAELSALAGADPFRGITGDQRLPGYPIRTVMDGATTGKTTITVVQLSESPVADSDFVVPEGYRTMQTPALPGMP